MIDTIEVQSRSKPGMTYPQYFSNGKMVGCGCDEAKAVHIEKYNFKPCHHMIEYNSRIPEDDITVHIEDELRGSCCYCGYPTKGVICWRCLS